MIAVLRVVAWDDAELLSVVNALSLWVYLPAWVVLGMSLFRRHFALAALSALVVAAQLVFVLPEFLVATPIPRWTRHAPRITVFDANIDSNRTFDSGYRSALASFRPDLIALEEILPPALRSLEASGALKTYPYRCSDPQYGALGLFLASRLPLTACHVDSLPWNGGDAPYLLRATARTREGVISVAVAHTLAPLPSTWAEWTSALTAIDRAIAVSAVPRTLLVGDLNATWGNRGLRVLLGKGLVDGAAARGQAFQFTWPNGAVVPPFARIDHILTGDDLAVTTIAAYGGFGSDHRYLEATVAIRP